MTRIITNEYLTAVKTARVVFPPRYKYRKSINSFNSLNSSLGATRLPDLLRCTCVFFSSIGAVLGRLIAGLRLAIVTGLLVILTNLQSSTVNASFTNLLTKAPQYDKDLINLSSTPPLPHPLPPTLAQWQDSTNSGDYFSQIAPTQVGYLVWSQFPVKVYVEPQAEAWFNAVLAAVKEWSAYLPLEVVEKKEVADIAISRKAPPLQTSPNSKILRARSALTTYEFYTNKNNLLSHRFTILLSPSQTGSYLTAAARHELGHALGIWGHSPLQTDALYFSQVRNPPSISSRDVNTLKRVYEQPTSLGWSSQIITLGLQK